MFIKFNFACKQKGDQFFNSGDLMCRDKQYCMHFVDRVGDTYRWKGENVSTNEVGDIVGGFPKVKIANCYGVEVAGLLYLNVFFR